MKLKKIKMNKSKVGLFALMVSGALVTSLTTVRVAESISITSHTPSLSSNVKSLNNHTALSNTNKSTVGSATTGNSAPFFLFNEGFKVNAYKTACPSHDDALSTLCMGTGATHSDDFSKSETLGDILFHAGFDSNALQTTPSCAGLNIDIASTSKGEARNEEGLSYNECVSEGFIYDKLSLGFFNTGNSNYNVNNELDNIASINGTLDVNSTNVNYMEDYGKLQGGQKKADVLTATIDQKVDISAPLGVQPIGGNTQYTQYVNRPSDEINGSGNFPIFINSKNYDPCINEGYPQFVLNSLPTNVVISATLSFPNQHIGDLLELRYIWDANEQTERAEMRLKDGISGDLTCNGNYDISFQFRNKSKVAYSPLRSNSSCQAFVYDPQGNDHTIGGNNIALDRALKSGVHLEADGVLTNGFPTMGIIKLEGGDSNTKIMIKDQSDSTNITFCAPSRGSSEYIISIGDMKGVKQDTENNNGISALTMFPPTVTFIADNGALPAQDPSSNGTQNKKARINDFTVTFYGGDSSISKTGVGSLNFYEATNPSHMIGSFNLPIEME